MKAMEKYVKIYVKLFLIMGICFGAIWTLIIYIRNAIPIDITNPLDRLFHAMKYGIYAGFLYGAIMSLIGGTFNILCVKKYIKKTGSNIEKDIFDISHLRTVELKGRYDKIYDLSVNSLSRINKCRVQKGDRNLGNITARTGASWKSFGEFISIEIRKTDEEHMRVNIISKPALRTTLIDYGKNLENVNKIKSFLLENELQ